MHVFAHSGLAPAPDVGAQAGRGLRNAPGLGGPRERPVRTPAWACGRLASGWSARPECTMLPVVLPAVPAGGEGWVLLLPQWRLYVWRRKLEERKGRGKTCLSVHACVCADVGGLHGPCGVWVCPAEADGMWHVPSLFALVVLLPCVWPPVQGRFAVAAIVNSPAQGSETTFRTLAGSMWLCNSSSSEACTCWLVLVKATSLTLILITQLPRLPCCAARNRSMYMTRPQT